MSLWHVHVHVCGPAMARQAGPGDLMQSVLMCDGDKQQREMSLVTICHHDLKGSEMTGSSIVSSSG